MRRSTIWTAITAFLATVFVVVIFTWGHNYWRPANPGKAPTPQQMELFLNHLQFLWERYLEMVQLLITLLTGVIAVSAGMVKLGPHESVANRGYFAAGITSLLVGLTCAVLWRIDSELLMEMEIFGDPGTVAALFKAHGVFPSFTSSYEYLDGLRVFSSAAYIFMVGTAGGLLAGLALMSLFAYSNLPEKTRQRTRASDHQKSHIT